MIPETETADEIKREAYLEILLATLVLFVVSVRSSVEEIFRDRNRLKKTWTFAEKKLDGAERRKGKVRTK